MTPSILPQTLSFIPGSTLAMSEVYEKYAPKIFFGLDAPHLHLLTNHLPIFVTLSGLFVLFFGLLRKNREMSQVALVLVFAGIAGGLLTYWLGQQSYKPVRGLADEVGQDWLDLHMERAEKVVWFFWMAGVAVAAAIVVAWKTPKFTFFASALAGLLGLGTVGLSGWIADAGGKIRHQEVRGEAAANMPEDHSEPHSH
ncbi:MAG: hypothetical protein ABJQ29_14625 [Luteolibacter sp.]